MIRTQFRPNHDDTFIRQLLRNILFTATVAAFIPFSHSAQTQGATHNQATAQFKNGVHVVFKHNILSVVENEKTVWKKKIPAVLPSASSTLTIVPLGDEYEAVHVKTVNTEKMPYEIVAIKSPRDLRLTILWKNTTQPIGDPGEQSYETVAFHDLNGDGQNELVIGTIFQSTTLCGLKKPPLLFRKVFDPRTNKLRTIMGKRPISEPSLTITGAPKPGDNQENTAEQRILGFIIPRSISSTAGDNHNPLFLSPPISVLDGQSNTSWVPSNGKGLGEFATFSVKSTTYGITQMGIQSTTKTEQKTDLDAPQSILLTTDDTVYRLTFPSSHTDNPVWFQFNPPIKSSCFSLILEQARSPETPYPIAIDELHVRTEIDGPEGISKLVRDLSESQNSEQALSILRSMGSRVSSDVEKEFPSLSLKGKRRALRLLGEISPRQSADLLAKSALSKDSLLADQGELGIRRAGDEGAIAIGKYLASKHDKQFNRAVKILSQLNTDAAFEQLLSTVGQGNEHRRENVRIAVTRYCRQDSGRQDALRELIHNHSKNKPDMTLFDLLRMGVALPQVKQDALSVVMEMLNTDTSFDITYRALRILTMSKDEQAVPFLKKAAVSSDVHIRELAILGLIYHMRNEQVRQTVTGALNDSAPQVRMAALKVFSRTEYQDEISNSITHLATQDPWPHVRKLAIANGRKLPAEDAQSIIALAISDKSAMVQLGALQAATQFKSSQIDHAINTILATPKTNFKVTTAAANAAGSRCQTSPHTEDLLFKLLVLGAEPLATSEEKNAGSAAAKALGALGTPTAKTKLTKARTRSNPTTDKAIDSALKTFGEHCSPVPKPAPTDKENRTTGPEIPRSTR